MTETKKKDHVSYIRTLSVGLVILGALLASLGFQVDGFLGGMGQGAGVTMAVLGIVLLGYSWRSPETFEGGWLPTRDGDR